MPIISWQVIACLNSMTKDGFETSFPSLPPSEDSADNFFHATINSRVTKYDPMKEYGQSKLANIHFANELDMRYGSQGLHALNINPRLISAALDYRANITDALKDYGMLSTLNSLEQNAAIVVWVAVVKEIEGKGGLFLEDRGKAGEALEAGVPMSGYSLASLH
ncbi:hypothetical protein EDB81DRAFT_760781 [Dactylonectria macrodidyma]|uniref:Uncharacterized protein n=1 Tax=Dactylonectria macrodidyma TaxID=307937 RepID=A0A9P9EQH0_9HYPO|nr:hypothetical protein EDB81DRAFT_760781 [Dactylonectria macrodidyma]